MENQILNAISILPGIPLSIWWISTSELYIAIVGIPYIIMCTCSFIYHMNYAINGYDPKYLWLDLVGQQILAYASFSQIQYTLKSSLILILLSIIIHNANLNNPINANLALGAQALSILIVSLHYNIKTALYWLISFGCYLLPIKYSGVLWHIGIHLSMHQAGVSLLQIKNN